MLKSRNELRDHSIYILYFRSGKDSKRTLQSEMSIYKKVCNMEFGGDSCFVRGIREICENHLVPRHFHTILAGLIQFN